MQFVFNRDAECAAARNAPYQKNPRRPELFHRDFPKISNILRLHCAWRSHFAQRGK
jgi:hypothetical protein